MKSIPVQQDNVTSLAADDFNQIPREEENLIQSADIVLDTGDLNQMGKAVSAYAGGGDFYDDAGTADAYVLTAQGSRKIPPVYFTGLRVRFKVANTNTGASTCQLGSLAALPISMAQIPNGGSPTDPVAGALVEDRVATLVYDESPDGTIPFWRLQRAIDTEVESVSLTKLISGIMQIAQGGAPAAYEAILRIKDTFGDQPYFQITRVEDPGVVAGRRMKISDQQIELERDDTPNTITERAVYFFPYGIRYIKGPGDAPFKLESLFKAAWAVTGESWTQNVTMFFWAATGLGLVLTGLDTDCQVTAAFLRYTSTAAEERVEAVRVKLDRTGTWLTVTQIIIPPATTGPDTGEDRTLILEFNGSKVS